MSRKELRQERQALRSQDYLVEKLASMSVPDFIDIIQEVLSRRNAGSKQYDFERSTLVLGLAYRMLSDEVVDGDNVWEKASCLAVGYVDYEHYGGRVGMDLLCQQGTCSVCGLAVMSVAKYSICPHCGSEVFCT